MTTVYHFAFGANMSSKVLRRRRIKVLSSELACLHGYRLAFDIAGLPLVEPAFASVAPATGHTVHGVLYRLDAANLSRLDTYEGPDYQTIEVQVEGERSGPCKAGLYQTSNRRAGLKPSRRYLRVLCEGATEHGLPDSYIDEVSSHPSAYVPLLSELTTYGLGLLEAMERVRNRVRFRLQRTS